MYMKLKINEEIILEQLELSHAPELFKLVDSTRNHLRAWLPWLDMSKNVSDTEFFINTTIDQHKNNQGPQFLIYYKNIPCGVIGFHPIDLQNRIGGIGYWLSEAFGGKGIVITCMDLMIKFGFETLGLNKIEVGCATENRKSRAIPEKLGFKLEATLRDKEWLYDHYVDQCLYSMLKREYNA